MPAKAGIAACFATHLDLLDETPGAELLRRALDYGVTELGFEADAFVKELVDSWGR
jgi:aspartate 4-decarboxylase